ncbi:MAG: amidohydrolase family protein [Phycisphaerae bacterium]
MILAGCSIAHRYDVIIRNGTIYDGSGKAPFIGDVAINGDTIGAVGRLKGARGTLEVDASGLAVAPGFINMLSWAVESLIEDGRSESDIRQGVTLEVFGEGWSWGPVNETVKRDITQQQSDIRYDIEWTTLGEYLECLVERGISPNIASFVGATTVRMHVLGHEDRPPTPTELDRMRELVRQAMEQGALGVGSSLIYAPAYYAKTDELVALCKVAAEYGGIYISHIRSEGVRLLEGVDELITIARDAGIPAEIYHLKAAGTNNWAKLDAVFEKIERARAEGLQITADMYTYTAAGTGLDTCVPPWAHEGGHEAMVTRLKSADIRKRVLHEMQTPSDEWENLLIEAGSPKNIMLVGFKNERLKALTGRTLADVASERGKTPEETILDLVIEDDSRVGSLYFIMSEDNICRKISKPWISFGSDEASLAPRGVFLKSNPHPRAYGTFARLLGRYVRDEGIISLEEAIRRITLLPARNLSLDRRGLLEPGYSADVVIFDPQTIRDHATFEEPHQYATGMAHVFVNGVQVLKDGEHTGAMPGRVVRGPGWSKSHATRAAR